MRSTRALPTSILCMMAIVLVTMAIRPAIGASTELAVAGRNNAFPSVTALDRFVAIAWGATAPDAPTDVFVAVSQDGGRSFGAPVQVNNTESRGNFSGEQPPRVALSQRKGQVPIVTVTWTTKTTAGTRLISARSEDGGKAFSPPAALSGSEAAGNRGWQSTAVDSQGRVVTLWLDHRELAPPAGATSSTPHSGHQHGATSAEQRDGVARAQLSKLMFAGAGGKAQTITGGVCYCCKTSIATGPDGAIYAAWRHVYPGNIRDIALTMSRDGGRTFTPPARVSDDRWEIDGCPENGPALAVDGRGVHVVWPTLVPAASAGGEPTLALFYAVTKDGRQFTPRQRISPDGFARHPQLALGARGELIVAWDEQRAGGGRRVVVARGVVDAAGAARFEREALGGDAAGTYPVVATTGSDGVVVWTSVPSNGRSVIRIERVSSEPGSD